MRFLLFIIIVFISTNVTAQENKYGITGHIVDNEGVEVIRASVTLRMAGDSTFKRQTVSDNNGAFTFSGLSDGKYELNITYIGLADYTSDVMVKSNTDVGIIRMDESSEMLEGITVMANYTDVKQTGETIVRVKGNPLAKGKSTVNFLSYIRELDVTNNGISVQGRSNTLIYLDNQQISFERLKNIPPSMISRIEIIPHADASYGVNATGGIIKVFLREEGGLLGTVTFDGTADKYGVAKTSPNANILYSRGKLSVNNFIRFTPYSRSDTESDWTTTDADGQSYSKSKATEHDKNFSDNLSLKYMFTKTSRLDIYGGVSLTGANTDQRNSNNENIMNMSSDGNTQSYGAGMQYKKNFGEDDYSFFRFKAEYSKNKMNSDSKYEYNGKAEPSTSKSDMDYVFLQPFVLVAINKNMRFNTGMQYSYLAGKYNDNGTKTLGYVPDASYDRYGYGYGAWLEFSANFGKNAFLQGGLNWHMEKSKYINHLDPAGSISMTENGVYPSLMFQWTINAEKYQYIQINYRSNYADAGYYYKMPVVTWQSDNLYSIGNPNIKQQKFHNAYAWFSLCRPLAFSYNFVYGYDMINVMTYKDENRPGVYYTFPENTGWRTEHILRLNHTQRLFKFWYIKNYIGVSFYREKAAGKIYSNVYGMVSSNSDFSIGKNYGLTLFMYALSKRTTVSYSRKVRLGMDIGMYASLFNDRLSLNLTCNNLFYSKVDVTTQGEGWTRRQLDISPYTRIQLTATWNFSLGKKIKNEKLPQTVNGIDERKPLGDGLNDGLLKR